MNIMEEAFLRYIRVLCHDMLNYLQVISGLSQLQQTERIHAYIREVSDQIKEIGHLARIGHPGLAAAVFGFLQWLSRFGIPYRLKVADAGTLQALLDDDGSAAAFAGSLDALGREMAFLEGVDRPVCIAVEVGAGVYRVRITLPGGDEKTAGAARHCTSCFGAAPAGTRGRSEVANEDGATVLLVTLPVTADAVRPDVEE